MGYCINQRDHKFFIAKKNLQKALAALKELAAHPRKMGGGSSDGTKWFSWVDMGFVNAKDFKTAMRCWRWDIVEDDKGDVTGIHFCGEKYGDEDTMFKALAPFVKKGSFIEMHGEDGHIWRWVFNGKTVKNVSAKVSFEED